MYFVFARKIRNSRRSWRNMWSKIWSLSLVKLKTTLAFLKMSWTTDIYSEFSEIFRTTISRGVLLLKYFAADYCLLVWLVTNLTLERVFFGEIFSETWTRTPCTAYLIKDTIPLCAQGQFVMYRLKIVTQVYMKLLPDNLVYFFIILV